MSHEQIQFFFEGDAYFEALWRDLNEARYAISIETYILSSDEIGLKLKEILIKKAKEGLRVKVMVDALGSRGLNKEYIRELSEAGVRFKRYHPVRLLTSFLKHINKRNHRKLVVVDSRIGYLGGMNFTREISAFCVGEGRWRDTQIRVTGPIVNKLTYLFKRSFRELRFRSRRFERFNALDDVLATRNFFGRNLIRHYIHRYIRRSRCRIRINSGYFIPDVRTLYALIRARKRGVCIQIVTCAPEYCDVPLVNRIQRPLLKSLIKRGVEIYFYKDRMMHAKSCVFDEKFATVGSSNINGRSFLRDCEINAFFRKEKWADVLVKQFEEDLKHRRLVTYRELKNIPLWSKALDWICFLLRTYF